jgi:hypothetical protein
MDGGEAMEPQIADYIRQNRQRYTRDSITKQLLESGYPSEAIEATWDRLASEAPTSEAPKVKAGDGGRAFLWIAPMAGLVLVLGLIFYAQLSALVWWVAIVLFVVVPAAWLSRARPLAAIAISIYVLLLVPIGFFSLLGAAYIGQPAPFIWTGLFVVLGALLVWQSYRLAVPSGALAWVGSILGVAAVFLIVAGATCLASLPFFQT